MVFKLYDGYKLNKKVYNTYYELPKIRYGIFERNGEYVARVSSIQRDLDDENGKEIPIKYIKKKYRPQILYLKKKYDSLKTCYYYNEDKQELDDEGVIIDENYEYMGQKYIKCTTIHLTAFTAGTYNFNSNIPLWVILLILSILLFVLISIIIIVRIVKKRKAKSRMSQFSDINSEFIQKDSPINQ